MTAAAEQGAYALLDRVFREEAGRLTASLVRLLGDFDLAEEITSDALVEALERWPHDGIPERPTSWLLTTARRKGIDRLRRERRYREKLALIASLPDTRRQEADDRLHLIFTCCHPVLAREAQIALTLRAVVGLTTQEIARAFTAPTETIAKRIVRAKRKIVDSGVPYRVPGPDELRSRLNEVLTVIYLVFNEAHLTTAGSDPVRRDLAADAEWLTTLLSRLLPAEPEVLGLLALIKLHLARWLSRVDAGGHLVRLEAQNRRLWNKRGIAEAVRFIERAATMGPPGPFLIEAAIAAVHCNAASWEETDWPRIVALYDILVALDQSPVVRLNRAIALEHVDGPREALREVDGLQADLARYHLFHATRAVLLRELGRPIEADAAEAAAIGLTRNEAEKELMARRLMH